MTRWNGTGRAESRVYSRSFAEPIRAWEARLKPRLGPAAEAARARPFTGAVSTCSPGAGVDPSLDDTLERHGQGRVASLLAIIRGADPGLGGAAQATAWPSR